MTSNTKPVYVIDRSSGGMLVAEDVDVRPSRVLEYHTPSGKMGYLQPDQWKQVQQKPESAVQDMLIEGLLSTDGEREFSEVR